MFPEIEDEIELLEEEFDDGADVVRSFRVEREDGDVVELDGFVFPE